MLEKSFALLYFLKQPKNQKQAMRYIYVRVTVNGVGKEFSTQRKWDIGRWDQNTGRATGTREDAKSLNYYLDTLGLKIYQIRTSLIDQNKEITAETIVNIATGKSSEKKLLLSVFKDYNSQIEALVGTDYSYRTFQRYRTTRDHTAAFIKWKYNSEDIPLIDLDYEFVSDYSFWLKTTKRCAHNSTMKYISTVKTVLKECIKRKWLKDDPFVDFKTADREVEIIPLTKAELQAINDKPLTFERLSIVRDIFLFSCYTGLAYVDVSNLMRSQIITGIDEEQWIITSRQKTKVPTRLPLLPVARAILDKYENHPKCYEEQRALPILSNQKMNAYLKEIADLCGITKKLTFHIARHTFATTVTLSNGVPIETVSKMLGHKSLKQTQHYAKIIDLKISEDMALLKQKLTAI